MSVSLASPRGGRWHSQSQAANGGRLSGNSPDLVWGFARHFINAFARQIPRLERAGRDEGRRPPRHHAVRGRGRRSPPGARRRPPADDGLAGAARERLVLAGGGWGGGGPAR